MTRVNVGIKPKELVNMHLQAELREIKRIPNQIISGKFSLKNQPKEFCLNTGHVKFFYDKLGYLRNRYVSLYNEAIERGLNVTNFIESFDKAIELYPQFNNDYIETERDRCLLIERINIRLEEHKVKMKKI